MSAIVIDNSIVLAWCLADEEHPVADRAMQLCAADGAVVPSIWRYELLNALIVNERRGRLTAEDARQTLADLGEMRIERDAAHDEALLLRLAREYRLSAYDAAYLEVALRRELPIASLDRRLVDAAVGANIAVVTG